MALIPTQIKIVAMNWNIMWATTEIPAGNIEELLTARMIAGNAPHTIKVGWHAKRLLVQLGLPR